MIVCSHDKANPKRAAMAALPAERRETSVLHATIRSTDLRRPFCFDARQGRLTPLYIEDYEFRY